MHVASDNRFVSFKAGGDRRDVSFFFYRAVHDYCFLSCMWPQVIDLFPSKQAGIAGVGRRINQNKCRTKKYSHFVLFSYRRFNGGKVPLTNSFSGEMDLANDRILLINAGPVGFAKI